VQTAGQALKASLTLGDLHDRLIQVFSGECALLLRAGRGLGLRTAAPRFVRDG